MESSHYSSLNDRLDCLKGHAHMLGLSSIEHKQMEVSQQYISFLHGN